MAAAITPPALMNHQQLLAHPMVAADKTAVTTHIATLTGGNTGLSGKVKKIRQFAADNPKIVINLKHHSLYTGAAAAAVAAVGGAIVNAAGVPDPSLVPKCAAFGFAFGFAAGAVKQVLEIRREKLYDIWESDAVPANLYGIFEKYVQADFSEFICPITHGLMKLPYRDSHGHVFEHAEILDHIARNGGHTDCPLRGKGKITKDDLYYDLTYHPRVIAALKPAFDTAVANPEAIRAALQFRQNVIDQNQQLLTQEVAPHMQEFVCGNITAAQFADITAAAAKKYKIS